MRAPRKVTRRLVSEYAEEDGAGRTGYPRGVGLGVRYSKNCVMGVHHRQNKSARRGGRHGHHLGVVRAYLGFAMLMTERGMLRIAASVSLLTWLRHRAGASPRALTWMRASVRRDAELREEQRHPSQPADPTEPNPLHLERCRHTSPRIPDFDMELNDRFPDSLRSRDGRAS